MAVAAVAFLPSVALAADPQGGPPDGAGNWFYCNQSTSGTGTGTQTNATMWLRCRYGPADQPVQETSISFVYRRGSDNVIQNSPCTVAAGATISRNGSGFLECSITFTGSSNGYSTDQSPITCLPASHACFNIQAGAGQTPTERQGVFTYPQEGASTFPAWPTKFWSGGEGNGEPTEDPTPEEAECMPSGWGLLNPLNFFRILKCLLVPEESIFDRFGEVRDAFTDNYPGGPLTWGLGLLGDAYTTIDTGLGMAIAGQTFGDSCVYSVPLPLDPANPGYTLDVPAVNGCPDEDTENVTDLERTYRPLARGLFRLVILGGAMSVVIWSASSIMGTARGPGMTHEQEEEYEKTLGKVR